MPCILIPIQLYSLSITCDSMNQHLCGNGKSKEDKGKSMMYALYLLRYVKKATACIWLKWHQAIALTVVKFCLAEGKSESVEI